MKISVVTAAWNSALTIEDCVASVARQRGVEVQHILIDGASSDDTVQRAEAAAHHDLRVISEPDDGIYDAMNKGIALAEGDAICLLNSDDFYPHERVLAEMVEALESGADAAFANLDFVDPARPERIVRRWRSRAHRPGLMRSGWAPAHPTLVCRRSVYERVGLFDTRYRVAADVDWMIRALEVHQVSNQFVDRVWVHMRAGGASNGTLRNILRANRECYHSMRANGQRPPVWYVPRKLAAKIPQVIAGRLGGGR